MNAILALERKEPYDALKRKNTELIRNLKETESINHHLKERIFELESKDRISNEKIIHLQNSIISEIDKKDSGEVANLSDFDKIK